MSNNLQDPAVKKAIRDALGEASGAMTRIDGEKDLIKEIAKKMQENHSIPKKTFRKMLATYHKQNFSQVAEETEEFLDMYESIWGKTTV